MTESQHSLDSIGIKTGTDKASPYHNYLYFYESYFSPFRLSKFTLIEVGVHKGASLAMWEEYFPNATIIGIDINPKILYEGRATVKIANAASPFFLAPFVYEEKPFIFIEDGSHIYSESIQIFEDAFISLQDGGFYICEDIQVSFGKSREEFWNDQTLDPAIYFAQIALLLLPGTSSREHPLLKTVTRRQILLAQKIEFIIFRSHCVLIKKKN